jgi:hypothetical protein
VSGVTKTADGYKLELSIVGSECLPDELFVMQRKVLLDEFDHIASPADIEEFPVDEPAEYGRFFRVSTIALVFPDLDLLRKCLTDLRCDLALLVETTNQLAGLTARELIVDADGVRNVMQWDKSIWDSGVVWGTSG